jgi:hypothetical protein
MLLDQEGFECDPINRREGDTPLHSAVRWANEVTADQREYASSLLEMMLEAGSDPRFVFYSASTSNPQGNIFPSFHTTSEIKEQDE